MEERKLKQFEIYKIATSRFTEKKGTKIKINPLTLTKRKAVENGELVKIQSNQLTNKILDYFAEFGIPNTKLEMAELIVNIVVPTEAKKSGEKEYAELAKKGFDLNGKHYVRLYSGSGQIRRNTITFIREDLYEPIFTSLLCGLTLADFGDAFNAAKFNAYCGLNMSGCYLLPEELTPNVCIVDDFEAIRPHNKVNCVTESTVEYITLPECDFILTDEQTKFDIADGKAIRKADGVEFTIHKGVHKNIEVIPYDEIENSPALNSFDGQGLMTPEWAQKIAKFLEWDYTPSEIIVRAPWVKGLLVTMPLKDWFDEHGITEITDSFGKKRPVAELDCIISKSQFKMHKIYKSKCTPMGVNAWDYHTQAMQENHLLWGINKSNNKVDDYIKALNYQYLQALQLSNDDIGELCKPTEEFLEKINSGNIEEVYINLVVNNKGFLDDTTEDVNYKKLFQQVIEANPALIDDKYIRELIFKECDSKLNGAKLGKILIRGNFQFCVSDPVAQLEWITKNHCGLDIEVKGIVPAGHIYSNYWLNADDFTEEITLLRSPLIDRNEIARRKLLSNTESYFRYLQSGLVFSIHDLTPLQQGGCDFDGDIIYSTNNPIVAKGCYSYEDAKPLYYELTATDLVGKITPANIINADIRGLNSKVGTISNKGGSLYANLFNYIEGSPEYENIYNSIIALGQIVGMEIDRIKTAVSPTFPMEWNLIQTKKKQSRDFEEVNTISEDEWQGIYRHNDLCPDVKPYYFRYNYDYLSKAITQLNKAFNKVCVVTYGMKLSEFIEECKSGNATEDMMRLYAQYQNAYPVIDTDCIVNHICHHFENFEAAMHKQALSEGKNMLTEFVSGKPLDKAILAKTENVIVEYLRFKKFMVRSFNTNYKESNKSKKEKTHNSLSMMRLYYRDMMLDYAGGDYQLAFDYLVAACKSDEKIVWEILDKDIIRVIKRG